MIQDRAELLERSKILAFAMNEQEDFLKQVVCLGAISQNAECYSANQMGVTAEEFRRRLAAALTNAC